MSPEAEATGKKDKNKKRMTAQLRLILVGLIVSTLFILCVAGFALVGSYTLNAFSPRLAGKFQISATVIKLVPITLMAIVGTIYGLKEGVLTQNFTTIVEEVAGGKSAGLFAAVVATVFAYEGWIVATSINAELKNAKKNLPIALVIYVVYLLAKDA